MTLRITDPAAFGRVAVLMGGWSSERQVSLWSGQGVLDALLSRGVDAVAVDVSRASILKLGQAGFQRAFNVLHGTGGEDGTVQAVLDLQNIPYTGSGVLASALAMDKLRTKRLWKAEGLPTPDYVHVHTQEELRQAAQRLGYPLILKPSEEGSSVGVSKVKAPEQLDAAFVLAQGETRRVVMAERFISSGRDNYEYTCAVLDGEALPIVRIEPDGEFYDYNAKYISDRTSYHCPSGLPASQETAIQGICLKAFELLGAQGWGRIDFILDADGHPWLIEANLVPGMTTHSLVPMAAKVHGLSYADLCWRLLETTMGGAA